MSAGNWFEKFPVIKGSWLEGDLVYHVREFDSRFLIDGVRQQFWSDEVNAWEIRTKCGLLLDTWTRDVDRNMRFTHLSAENAALIARPCRKCWDVVA